MPGMVGEIVLGRVYFAVAGIENIASFWTVDGSFFSIEFKLLPTKPTGDSMQITAVTVDAFISK
jgi:hypothetical protein